MAQQVTYGQLHQLLLDLEFVAEPVKQPWNVYRHAETKTLILLADRKPTLPARNSDLASVRRHLLDNGLIQEHDFESFLSYGRVA